MDLYDNMNMNRSNQSERWTTKEYREQQMWMSNKVSHLQINVLCTTWMSRHNVTLHDLAKNLGLALTLYDSRIWVKNGTYNWKYQLKKDNHNPRCGDDQQMLHHWVGWAPWNYWWSLAQTKVVQDVVRQMVVYGFTYQSFKKISYCAWESHWFVHLILIFIYNLYNEIITWSWRSDSFCAISGKPILYHNLRYRAYLIFENLNLCLICANNSPTSSSNPQSQQQEALVSSLKVWNRSLIFHGIKSE
jgi:hypothetical protein